MFEILLDEEKEGGLVVSDEFLIDFFDAFWVVDSIFLVHELHVNIALFCGLVFGMW